MAQKKAIKVELASLDQLDTELKSNRGELSGVLSRMNTIAKEIESLRESYAYLSGQYDSMYKASITIGDSNLTGKIVKALNESNQGYNEINKIYQKIK